MHSPAKHRASTSALQALILRQGFLLAIAGSVIGISVALMSTRLLTAVLYGVNPADPLTYAAIVGVVLVAAALACWIPARRAGRIDPMRVLGTE